VAGRDSLDASSFNRQRGVISV